MLIHHRPIPTWNRLDQSLSHPLEVALHLRAELFESSFNSHEVSSHFIFDGVLQLLNAPHVGEEFHLLRFIWSDPVDRGLFHELDDSSKKFVLGDVPVSDPPPHLIRQRLVKIRPPALEGGPNLYLNGAGPRWTQDYMDSSVPGVVSAPAIKHIGRHTTIPIVCHDRLDYRILLIKSHISLEPDPCHILDAGQLVVRLPPQLVS